MMMLPGIPKDGQCPECAEVHEPDQPHNRDSLRYQYMFYDAHGRWPSWADAMAHCSSEVAAAWAAELRRIGIEVDEAPGTGHLTVSLDAQSRHVGEGEHDQ